MTPPPAAAAAPAVAPRRTTTPARRSPRRAPQPARRPRRAAAPAARPLRAIELAEALTQHRLLDRLIRGRAWIGLLAFALIGIVAMQLWVLKLNAGIGRAVEHAGLLERQNTALSIANSEASSGDRVEQLAAAEGMVAAAPGTQRFLTSRGVQDTRMAAAALARPVRAPVTTATAPVTTGTAEPGASSTAEPGAGTAAEPGASQGAGATSTTSASPSSPGSESSTSSTATAPAAPAETSSTTKTPETTAPSTSPNGGVGVAAGG